MGNDALLVLSRRHSLFQRLTTERTRLEAVTERCAQKLAAFSVEILRSNVQRRIASTTDLPELKGALATAESLEKWRSRLTRGLVSLRAATERLENPSTTLTLATAGVFSGTLQRKTRLGSAARVQCTTAADALDAARSTPFERHALPAAVSLRLRNRCITRATAAVVQAEIQHAVGQLSEVISTCHHELVAITVAHAPCCRITICILLL